MTSVSWLSKVGVQVCNILVVPEICKIGNHVGGKYEK